MAVTEGYRSPAVADTRKRVGLTLTRTEQDEISVLAEADGRTSASWATQVVRRALEAQKQQATLQVVSPDQGDLLRAFSALEAKADGSAAAISDLLHLGLTSESVRRRVVDLAEQLQSALAAPRPGGAKQPKKP